MKLGTISTAAGTRAVIIEADQFAPIDGYADIGTVLRDGRRGREAIDQATTRGVHEPLDHRALLRPVLAPSAVVCVGLNYRTHIREMGRALPEAPTLFSKLARALSDPYADIELPAVSECVDYEGELAVVIGTAGRDVHVEDAWRHVAGLTVLNDVTARDFQRRTVQWFAGKTFQSSTPVGPWIVTPDELPELSASDIVVTVNGEERQRSTLGDLVFDVPTLVSDLSRIVALEPGDIIATGTPGGVGEPDGRFLRSGDVVSVTIVGIGSIQNTFR